MSAPTRISGVLTRHKPIRVTFVWYPQPRLLRSSTTSRFDFSIRLLVQCTVYRREDFTVDTLTRNLLDRRISMLQVKHTGVGKSCLWPAIGLLSNREYRGRLYVRKSHERTSAQRQN